MEIAITLLVLTLLVFWIVLMVRKRIKAEQERKLEEQRRAAEAARIEGLRKVGENITTTVRYADEYTLRTEGRHPDTGQLLTFTGVRGFRQKQYFPGDLVHVLIDRQYPRNYMMQWDTAPLQSDGMPATWT